ncbi:MAG: permease-like cell division protein FtsX [Candidatus Buchananbacteria bacterium]
MFLVSFYRSIKFALQSFSRNFWLSLITIFIIVLTFLSLNFLVVLNFLTNSAITAVKDKIDISLYFETTVKESAIAEVKQQIQALPQVKEIKYVSAEQNLETFKNRNQQNDSILATLQALQSNPLGGTIIIKAKELADYPIIFKAIDTPEINELLYEKGFDTHQEIISRITNLTQQTQTAGIVISLIFAIIVALIVFNTIRIAIFAHREEIAIMKLVGASNWFIRAPFIFESFLYALIGCLVAVLLIYGLLSLLQPQLVNFFQGLDVNIITYYNQNWYLIFGAELLVIMMLNFVSCSLAVGKYLKA